MRNRQNNKQAGQGARRKSGGARPKKNKGSGKPDRLLLYGLHTVRAALQNSNREKYKLYATDNGRERLDPNDLDNIEIETVDSQRLRGLVGDEAVHQGVVLSCAPLPVQDASELFQLADANLVLALDQITDPHNVGAILRTAVAFGVDAVLTTHRQSASETATLAKSASGALDLVPQISVRHLAKAISELNEMGFSSIGLDSEGDHVLEREVAAAGGKPILLVLGAEGRGLREKTRETCSALARLDMPGAIKSLNVSNATALALYIVSRRNMNGC